MAKAVHNAGRLTRVLRHFMTGQGSARAAFPKATLHAIQASIGTGETRHRAQVRVIIESALSVGAAWRGETSRQRAHVLFGQYRIWDTEENCGVLVYLNLADHKIEIVADRGVSRLVSRQQWQQVCALMTGGYARGDYHDTTLQALDALHALLAQVMPRDAQDHGGKELSDKPIVL